MTQKFFIEQISRLKLRFGERAFDAESQKGLKVYLEREFPGCKTLNEAIEVRRLQIRLARVEDKNYDPMKDPKWT